MRILVLVPSFRRVSPIEGLFGLAAYLHRRRHHVFFGALDGTDLGEEDLRPRVLESGMLHAEFEAAGWTGVIPGAIRVQRFLRAEAVEVVISALLKPDLVNAMLRGVLRVASVRIITSEGLRSSHGPLVASMAGALHGRALRRMDGVFTMTDAMSEHLRAQQVGEDAIWRVNNFIDVHRVRERASRRARDRSDRVELGIFGRLIRRKRVDVMIRALAKVRESPGVADLRLNVVGDGPLRHELSALASTLGVQDDVVFHGHVEEPLPLMGRMDVVVLTSESEGTPRAIMEALALGKTCVVSDIGAVRPLVIDGSTGYTFPLGDADALGEVVRRIITEEMYLNPDHLLAFMLERFDVATCGELMLARVRGAWGERPKGADTGDGTA